MVTLFSINVDEDIVSALFLSFEDDVEESVSKGSSKTVKSLLVIFGCVNVCKCIVCGESELMI